MKQFYLTCKGFDKNLSVLKYILVVALVACYPLAGISQNNLTLWYDEPAEDWMTEALPIGNGYMGVMFFGGIDE